MDTRVKSNSFVRILIVVFTLLILAIIGLNFVMSKPPYLITPEMITLLLIITILILSESFDNFSIAKLFTVSKQLQKKEVETEKVKKENNELREQIIRISSVVSQKQVQTTNNINVPLEQFLQNVKVVKSDLTEDKTDETAQETIEQKIEVPKDPKLSGGMIRARIEAASRQYSLNRYISEKNIHNDFTFEVEFSPVFTELDPIMERQVTFDGYYSLLGEETFVEHTTIERLYAGGLFVDRLYVALSKILLYKKAKNINAHLVLVISVPPHEYLRRYKDISVIEMMNHIARMFDAAISSRLLIPYYIDVPKPLIEESIEYAIKKES